LKIVINGSSFDQRKILIGADVQSKETSPIHEPADEESVGILPRASVPGKDVVMPPRSF
jgi:hypothetical protein